MGMAQVALHPSECVKHASYMTAAHYTRIKYPSGNLIPLCGRCGKFIQVSPNGYWWVSEYMIEEAPW